MAPAAPAAKPLNWGILGCARISRRGLIPGIQGSNSGQLLAIASRNVETARAWGGEFSIPKAYGSYEDLIADPEIDAIYNPLPNELHRPWTDAAVKAGKHVLCEKPLALDAAEAEAMARHAQAHGRILMEAFMWRHQPRTLGVQSLVAQGAIGPLRLVRSSFSFPIDLTDWRLDPARGAGALWDVGCYGVSTARLFAGAEPERIRALAHFSDRGVDLSLTTTLQFPDGVLAAIDCSFEQPFRCVYELVGERGTIVVPDAYLPPERPTALLTTADGTQELSFDGRNQYACMVDAFAASVLAGRLVAPAETGVGTMRCLEAILTAARQA